MPRIFKGSESTLRLLISKTGDYQALTGIKIKLYTTDIENAIEIIDGIQVCKNIAIITLAPRAFMGMEDGLINYIIDGATEDDVFHTERQSNYMLKSLSYINEDGVATQTMTIESNGEYRVTPNDGLYVDINVNVPDLNGSYDEGYEQGKTDGINEQKGKLESINITENGTYTKEDGYNEIVVEVPDLNGSYDEGYGQGKTDGVNEQKSKLESINITENGTYTKGDGYNQIEVNVPDLNGSYDEGYNQGHTEGYNEGKTDGVNEQKGKLSQIRITENGTYAKEDGYSEVVVDVPDLNGSYDEGYNQGKIDGANEQKSKLESINITENGVYSKEDGYNHIEVNVPDLNGSYDEGYAKGQRDMAADARMLDVTENGVYRSKFSDPIIPANVTGVYADGTNFYSYAELKGKVFNTKIAATIDSRLEFWYKGDNIKSGGWDVIIGSGDVDNSDCFQVRYFMNDNDTLRIEVGNSITDVYGWDDTVWHHLIVSKAEGLWIDGEKWWDFSASNTINGEFFINGIGYNINKGSYRTANGTFGMIKIDDTVIIPTADGFLNTNTGELLEVMRDGTYTFTENLPIYGEGELYKTINVNVPPKINVQEAGLKFGYSIFTDVPEWADSRGITDMSYMFFECRNLQTIPMIDTSKVTNMRSMFENCSNLQTISPIDTSKVTNMVRMFYYCTHLQTISQIDTSKVTNMNYMFYYCSNLRTLPELDASNVTSISSYFSNGGSNLTDVGGWKNLKINWNDNYGLKLCPNLTYQSCINVLNGLYDFVGNGSTETRTLKVHPNFLTTVGDEISIGTNKGWTITA